MHRAKNIHDESTVSQLMELGLTERQAKIYLQLVKLGCSNLTDVSTLAEIARGDVFRTMSSLQEKNLVFKIIDNPTKFEAVPIQDALRMLIETKEQELARARRSANQLIEDLKTSRPSPETSKGPQFVLIPEKQLWRYSGPMVDSARIENCLYLSWKSFCTVLNNPTSHPSHISCAKRGVRNRWITENPRRDILNMTCFRTFVKLPSVEIRYSIEVIKVNLFLSDREQAFFTTVESTNVGEHPNIWTNNPCVVEMAQDFFEKKWKEAIPANSQGEKKSIVMKQDL